MGKLILRTDTQEALHRPELTDEVEGYGDAVFLDVADDFTLKDKRVDWTTLTIVDDAQAVRDRRWEDAKAHYETVCSSGFVIDGVGTIQTMPTSREAIRMLADEARDRIADGEPEWTTAFVNEANEAVPLNAPQILAIYATVRAFLGECYAVCQGKRAALDAAVAAGASASQIEAVDILAGYPGPDWSPA